MSYQNHIPFLKRQIGDTWYDKSVYSTRKFLESLITHSHEFRKRGSNRDPIIMEYYVPDNNKSLTKEYIPLLKEITRLFNVWGVWVKMIDPKTESETIVTLRLYGFEQDVKHVLKLTQYYHKGLEHFREHFQTEYRRLRINRRRRTDSPLKKEPEDHAKYKANVRIDNKLKILTKQFLDISPELAYDTRARTNKILNHIQDREKLNYRKYKTKGEPPIEMALGSSHEIQLNRIL